MINSSISNNSIVCTQLKFQTVLFDPLIGSYQVLPLWVRVSLGAMALKEYSIFLKALTLLEPYHQVVECHIQNIHWWGESYLCRNAVSVFYNPNQLDLKDREEDRKERKKNETKQKKL